MAGCKTLVVLVAVVACVCPAFAQFVPEIGATAQTLARGGAGIAISNEEATGQVNPAALPFLFRRPQTRSLTAGRPATGVARRQDGAGPSYRVATLDQSHAPLRLALDTAQSQVTIESRFLQVDQKFVRDLGVNWDTAPVTLAGYAQGTTAVDNFRTLQVASGRIGEPSAFGAGFVKLFDDKFYYGAFGQAFHQTDSGGMASWGVKLSGNDLQGVASKLSADVGGLIVAPRLVALAGHESEIQLAIGLRYVDAFDAYGHLPGAGSRLDLGVGATADRWRLAVDVTDVFDQTKVQGPTTREGGSHVNAGASLLLGNCLTVSAGRTRGETTYGAGVDIPRIGNLPFVGRLFAAKAGDDKRVELMVFITPHIVSGEE